MGLGALCSDTRELHVNIGLKGGNGRAQLSQNDRPTRKGVPSQKIGVNNNHQSTTTVAQ
jgi:hypothetical protein